MDYLTDASNEIKSYFATHNIPTYFYQCLFGECIKIWGINLVEPDNSYKSYREQIAEYLSLIIGTGGWRLAMKETCAQCEMTDMYKYYEGLDWVESDCFDNYIVGNLEDVLFAYSDSPKYYGFKMRKEKNDGQTN